MPAQTLAKTDAGRAEIRSRTLPLSRAARNLLLIIDGAHDSDYWLGAVKGSTEADLHVLLQAGLVAPVAPARGGTPRPAMPRPAAASPARPPVAAEPPTTAPDSLVDPSSLPPLPRIPLAQALERVNFRQLYDRLTAEARPRLGLIAGYRAILAIERATDIEQLRLVALEFVEQVRQSQGDAAAQQVAQKLADGR